jgi:hypothetical protein
MREIAQVESWSPMASNELGNNLGTITTALSRLSLTFPLAGMGDVVDRKRPSCLSFLRRLSDFPTTIITWLGLSLLIPSDRVPRSWHTLSTDFLRLRLPICFHVSTRGLGHPMTPDSVI